MKFYHETLNSEILNSRFPGFEAELAQQISKHGQWAHVEQGDILMQSGGYIQGIPLVLDGLLRIYREDDMGRENQLYYLQRGEVCATALTCCSSKVKSTISAVAEEDTDVLIIPIKFLDEWMDRFPTWKHFVMQAYKSRFDELLETIDSLAFKKMDQRLISFLIDYNHSTGKTEYHGKHEDIARALTSSREVISRLLKVLEKEGKITLSRNNIDFKNLL